VQASVFIGVLGLALVLLAPAWWDKLAHLNDLAAAGLSFVAQWGVPLLLAVAVWLTLAPVEFWLAVTED